jgi:hypothetical protein
MRRVTASEATRKRIAEMLRKAEGLDRSELVRQAARLVIEVTDIVAGNWKVQKVALNTPSPRCVVCRAGNRR